MSRFRLEGPLLTTVHFLEFVLSSCTIQCTCVHELHLTKTFLLVCSSVRSKQQCYNIVFCTWSSQKSKQEHKKLSYHSS